MTLHRDIVRIQTVMPSGGWPVCWVSMSRPHPFDRRADVVRPVRRPWRSALVLVCRECDGAKGFGPKRVRKAVKARAKTVLPPKTVRVATVSCLDVCPQRATCVTVVGAGETTVTVSGPRGAAAVVDRVAQALATDGAA